MGAPGQLVGIEIFVDAGAASGSVLAGKAIQEALVPLATVAMAIARLLVERLLDFCSDGIGVLHYRVGKQRRIDRRG